MRIAYFSRNKNFAGHIIRELRQHHTVKVWDDRQKNKEIWWGSVLRLLDWCDIAYLEWLQQPTLEISQLQAVGKPMVAFCHGIDVMNHSMVLWSNIDGLITQPALYPRLLRLRQQWHQRSPDQKLAPLPKTLITSLGIDLGMFTVKDLPPTYHIVMHASQIRPTKRIYTGIQQFYDLIHEDTEHPWKLTLIGHWDTPWQLQERKEYLTALKELIDQLKFPPNRLFIKAEDFPRKEWAGFLKTADVYWCPSWRESFGASMAEAAATGVYPLMNDFLGADEIYPLQYRCKTPGEMIRKTIAWAGLSDEEKLAQRKKIREHITQYDARDTAKRIRRFLEQVEEDHK